MARRTLAQNKSLAKKIRNNLGDRITNVCEGTLVPTGFLAGLISVEDAPLDETATRFEEGIFVKLRRARDGQRPSFNGVKTSDIAGASDGALRNLSTSFGLTQILGLHVIATFNKTITVNDLRDPAQHLTFAVQFIEKEGGAHLRDREFEKVLRIHNTGRPDGVTFSPDYVPNALGVMSEYEALEA